MAKIKSKSGREFAKGDKVTLISGGPVMAVNDPYVYGGGVECQWFSGKKLESGKFAPETLVLVKEGDGGDEQK